MQNAEGIRRQEHHIPGMAANSRYHGIVDEAYGIRCPRIFRLAVVVVVRNARMRIERYILQHAAKAQGIPDLRLILLRQLDALGIASAFEVKDAIGAPSMLVITDQV